MSTGRFSMIAVGIIMALAALGYIYRDITGTLVEHSPDAWVAATLFVFALCVTLWGMLLYDNHYSRTDRLNRH